MPEPLSRTPLHASSNRAPAFWCRLWGHAWVDMRNKVILSGEWCPRCGAIRPGPEQGQEGPDAV